MITAVAELAVSQGHELALRGGIASGQVIAGVIGRVQVPRATRNLLAGNYELESHGPQQIKGVCTIETWLATDSESLA